VDDEHRSVFAAVRPPGHHAGRATYGGSCFLNNAAIAAQCLAVQGRRVAIVDLDAHHGNGTQEIFYDRADVYFGSLHADPAHEYPYWCGYADERGAGRGRGTNRNVPLPANCDDAAWLAGLERLLGDIDTFSPDALVVSLGVDGLIEDPNSTLALTPDAFVVAGEWLGSLQRPMLCVLEGGYVLDLLGSTLLGFLHAADRAR
jgi:acetoin utilization deacetylase AcuC-like enzyme